MTETFNHDPRPRTLQECAMCVHGQLACIACGVYTRESRGGWPACADRCRAVREQFITPAWTRETSSPCALGNTPTWRFVHGRWGWWAPCNDHQAVA